MSDRHLSDEDETAIVALAAQCFGPNDQTDSEAVWAEALDRAFAEHGRLLVNCRGLFWCYAPKLGCFEALPELELKRLLFRCKAAGKAFRSAFVASVLSALEARVFRDVSFFDAGRSALTCANGTLVFKDEPMAQSIVFEESTPAHRSTARIPVPFVADADINAIEDVLKEWLVEPEVIELVLGLVGLALLGQGCRYQVMLLLTGEGANGKGVFSELVRALLPSGFHCTVQPQSLKHDYWRIKLNGARINFANELDRVDGETVTQLKAAISGEALDGRPVRGNAMSFVPRALFVVSTNQLPNLGARTAALERRMLVIPFPNVIPRHRRDPQLAQTLKAFALPGLLRLCIEAAQRLCTRMNDGDFALPIPNVVRAASEQLFGGADDVQSFVADAIEETGDFAKDRIRSSDLLKAYEAHCQRRGMAPRPAAAFKHRMEELGFAHRTSDGVKWLGVRFKANKADCEALRSGTDGPEASEGGA